MVPPLGVVKEKVTVLVVLAGRHCAVGVALRRAVDDEVPSAVEKKTGPAAVRRISDFGGKKPAIIFFPQIGAR